MTIIYSTHKCIYTESQQANNQATIRYMQYRSIIEYCYNSLAKKKTTFSFLGLSFFN